MRKTWAKTVLTATVTAALAASVAATTATTASAGAAPSQAARQGTSVPSVDQEYPVVREAMKGLPNHTVYRPTKLKRTFQPRSVPVLVWGNGACRSSNWGFIATLTLAASHGYVVLAVGAPDAPAVAGTGGDPQPERLVRAINWAEKRNKRLFGNRLDLDKIAVAGQSCGGLEALVAGADPRVASVASVNSGFFETPYGGYDRSNLADLHTPTLIVNGGPEDVAYQNSIDNYELLEVPGVLASNAHAGHSGLWYGIRDGEGNTEMLTEGSLLLTNWLDFTLNDQPEARSYFLGEDCTLCTKADWTVSSKGF